MALVKTSDRSVYRVAEVDDFRGRDRHPVRELDQLAREAHRFTVGFETLHLKQTKALLDELP